MPNNPNPHVPGSGNVPPSPTTVPVQDYSPTPAPQPTFTNTQQSAFDTLTALLNSYGLTSLSDFVKQKILDGADGETIMLEAQLTNEWKQRFAGNEALKAMGLGVLSPAEYLATERSYAQVMKNYGLPSGFYDDPADFAKWIGSNVSPSELQQRVSAYSDLANREDPTIVQQLHSMGMGKGDILAYMMDPGRAAPLIQRQYQTALLGSAARRAGVVADNNTLSQLAGQGITEQQASQGFGQIGGSLNAAGTLASAYGETFGQQDLQSEVFNSDSKAGKKRKRLASQERASFSGQSGISGVQQGTSGSY